jgi:hypothetical protein
LSLQFHQQRVALQRLFAELKKDKDADEQRPNEEWLSFFDVEAVDYFFQPLEKKRIPTSEELQYSFTTEDLYESRREPNWDFDSVIEAFFAGEFNLLECENLNNEKGRLTFHVWAYPYGGVGCMVALIEAFGGIVGEVNGSE